MDDHTVPTSDSDELEELQAEEDLVGYWANAMPALARNLAIVRAWYPSTKRSEPEMARRVAESRQTRSDDEGSSGRPRKRARMQHSLSDENVGHVQSGSTVDTGNSRRVAGDISNSPRIESTSFLGKNHPRTTQSSPDHASSEPLPSTSKVHYDASPDSPELRLRTPEAILSQSPNNLQIPLEAEYSDALFSDDLPVLGHSKSSQSYVAPSPSQDPLLLSNSPNARNISEFPSLRHLTPPSPRQQSVGPQDDHPIAGPSRLRDQSRHTSPRSPSPVRLITTSPHTPTPRPPLPGSSPLTSEEEDNVVGSHPQPNEAATEVLLAELQREGGRYSLRERNVRQKRPYAYDQQVYERQLLDFDPEAIVKPRSSPRRKHRERSKSPAEALSSDGEVNPADLDLDASDHDRRRRRARSTTAPAAGRARRRTRSSSISAAGRDRPGLHDRSRVSHYSRPATPPSHRKTDAWYQDELQGLNSSSSEDDLDLPRVPPPQPHDEAQPQLRKRRKKRFPMRVERPQSPDFRLFTQPPSPPRRVPKKRTRPPSDSSDVEVLSPIAGPSRSRSRSPEREQDPWDALDDVRFDERLPSPASNPPTSSSVQVSDGFDLDLEHDRWGSPPPHGSDDAMSETELSPRHHADADASDEDGSQLGSRTDEESELERRRRYRVLCRLYPKHMARRMLEGEDRRAKTQKSKPQRRSVVPEDAPLRPGQTRVRVGSRRDAVLIAGDPESSDAEVNLSSSRSPSRGPSPVAGPSFTSRLVRRTVSRGTIYVSSDSESEEDVPQDDPDVWINEPTAWHESSRGIREGTLVDYMLNRTNNGGRKRGNAGSRRTGNSGRAPKRNGIQVQVKGGGPRKRTTQQAPPIRTRVTVGGARKYGPKRQSRLQFPRADTNDDAPAATEDRNPFEGDFPLDLSVGGPKVASSSSSKPAWKKGRNRTRDRVYFLKPKVVKVVSGRVMHEPRTTVIEQDAPTIQIMQFPSQARPPVRRSKHRVPLPTRQTVLNDAWRAGDSERLEGTGPSAHTQARRKNKDTITVDMGITKLPSGISFTSDTYLSKGYLHDLLSSQGHIDLPPPGYIGTSRISESTNSSEFVTAVTETLTEITSLLELSPDTVTPDTQAEWRRSLHVVRSWTAPFLSSVPFDDAELLQQGLVKVAERIYAMAEAHFAVKADDSPANLLSLQLQWSAIELIFMVRRAVNSTFSIIGDDDLSRHLKLLMQHLLACNVGLKLGSLWPIGFEQLHYGRPPHLVAEIWICLIHFVEQAGTRGAFWTVLQRASQDLDKLGLWQDKITASEAMWTCIFGFAALSQFSQRGVTTPEVQLPESWNFVAAALQQSPLILDRIKDAKLEDRGLKKRDKYIKLLISRCFWLHSFWNWSLESSGPMFHSLLPIFRSRDFANLLTEKVADFPAFLKEHKIELLFTREEDDSAFTLFLKLLVKAAGRRADEADSNPELPQSLKKYLTLAVPLGSVPFKGSLPASPRESSMLYNRLSAVAVAMYLEQTADNARNRMTQARRYVNFKETDQGTRQACIRGVMYLTILLQHLNLPVDVALDWLGEMTNCLVDEFFAVQRDGAKWKQRNGIVKTIQMILACARRVIETPHMDAAANKAPRYPSTALLQGPWVTRVFAASSGPLASTLNTALEMRMLVQAFLKARNAVLPRPPIRQAQPVVQEESQEDYGDFGFDLDDPAVAAALGIGDAEPTDPELKIKEEETCKVIDEYIIKAVFRVLLAHLSSRQQYDQQETDKLLECWVGCAEVLVRNGRRSWAAYFDQASQTWQKMQQMQQYPLKLRRVNLCFSLTVLKHDASSYSAQQDHYIRTFFQCMVTPQPELEAEYVALLFTVDDMQHPLFRGLPTPKTDDSGHFQLTRAELVERRVSYIEHIIGNVERCLAEDTRLSPTISERNEQYVGYIACMLSAMRDVFKSLDVPGQAVYTPFCTKILGLLSHNVNVQQHRLLHGFVTWMKTL